MISKKAMQYIMAKKRIVHENIKINVVSNCMAPLAKANDVIEIQGSDKYYIGDIVAIYVDEEIRLHRIVSMTKNSVQTKGDLSYQLDSETNWKYVIGLAIRNCTKEYAIQRRRKLNAEIAGISYNAAKLYSDLKVAPNHANLKTIAMLQREIQKLNVLYISK